MLRTGPRAEGGQWRRCRREALGQRMPLPGMPGPAMRQRGSTPGAGRGGAPGGKVPGFTPSPQLRNVRRTRQVEHEKEGGGDAYVDSVDSVEAKFHNFGGLRGVDGPEP
jgi:hypothetical protein